MNNNVIKLPVKQTGLTFVNGEASGDERLAIWMQAAANLADALGIHVEIRGDFHIHAEHVQPLPTLADLTEPE